MSLETKAALDSALAAHISDEMGSDVIVTGYVLHAAHMSDESISNGTTGYFEEYGDRQPFHVCLGLAHQLVMNLETGGDDDD